MNGQGWPPRGRKKSRTKTKATTARRSGRENKSDHHYQDGNYLKALATSPTNQEKPTAIKDGGDGLRMRTKMETKKKQKTRSIKCVIFFLGRPTFPIIHK